MIQRSPLSTPETPSQATPEAPAAAGHDLVLIESTVDHAFGRCGNVSLYVWRKLTLPSAMAAVVQSFEEARRAGAGRFANYGVAEADSSLPEAEMRARLAHLMRDFADDMAASAFTFEGTGFRAAAVRTAATGLALIARQPYPHRIFNATRVAADWLVGQMGRRGVASPSAEAIDRAITALRASPPGSATLR